MLSNCSHNCGGVTADYFYGLIFYHSRKALGSPSLNSNNRKANSSSERQFEIDPLAMANIHSADNKEDIRRAHLVSKLSLTTPRAKPDRAEAR
jgi:hypothetical protein